MSRLGVPDLFGDDEDRGPVAAAAASNKRARPSAATATATQQQQQHQPPFDPEVREAADKLADFVAKNGRQYEHMTRERNPPGSNNTFKFLWEKGSSEYAYYESRLTALERQYGTAASAAAAPAAAGRGAQQPHHQQQQQPQPLPHQWQQHSNANSSGSGGGGGGSGRKRNRWDDKASSAAPASHAQAAGLQAASVAAAAAAAAAVAARLTQQASAGGGGGGGSSSSAGAGAGAGGSSNSGGSGSHTLSAMEQYMKRLEEAAAKKKREDEEEEAERKRRAAAPLLKETAFDRRKVVAVYKDDGDRGHHMQDYIPKEELAKFLAKCGDTQLQQQVEAEASIGADNVGHKLLQKMGWQQGKGVGAKEAGRTAPVVAAGGAAAAAAAGAAGAAGGSNLGLGAEAHGAVKEDDDPFEQYRKRMMLGYKYRPNPLGNPRRSYY